jgi:enoyl-CoA hydratase
MRFIETTDEGSGVLLVRMLPASGPVPAQLEIHEEITDVLEHIRDSRDVRAAVITGTDDLFYAGPVLESLASTAAQDAAGVTRIIDDARRIVRALVDNDKPIVAAVNGPAIGLGCQLAFFSDFCFAVATATFQDTHVRVGLPAGDGGTLIYPLLFGLARAKRYLMTGERMSAQYAEQCGAVEAIVERERLLEVAIGRARRLVGANYEAVRATKAALNRMMHGGPFEAFELAVHAEHAAMLDTRTHAIMQGIVDRAR